MGIVGNENVNELAKSDCIAGVPNEETERGLRALWRDCRPGRDEYVALVKGESRSGADKE